MKKIFKSLLSATFLFDFFMTFFFGLISWFLPKETFGTIILIPQENEPLILSLFSSLSIFYIVIGLVCLVGFKASFPLNNWIGTIMILRHSWIGIIGILGVGHEKDWVIGNLVPDIVIHAVFTLAYILGIFFMIKRKNGSTE